jgi:hypothetical protein
VTGDPPIVDASAGSARHARLLGVKLRALVRDHLSDASVGEPVAFAPGAALLHREETWILLDDQPTRRLGAALAWATRAGARALHVITESGSGVLARRAAEFTTPIDVWHAEQRTLLPAVPEAPVPEPAPPTHHLQFRSLIAEGGAEPIEEHGVLAGEVRGLEVCRVVDDPDLGEPRLEVGIGAHDRDAFAMIHGSVPTADSLARVVATVEEQRSMEAPPHPFNRLARERLLRWQVVREPSLVGAMTLAPVSPPVPRLNVKESVPCVAAGRDTSGRGLVVVCSVGVDLDVIPFAADARLAADAGVYREAAGDGRDVRLAVVTPARDRVKVTEQLAGLLRRPCELVTHG